MTTDDAEKAFARTKVLGMIHQALEGERPFILCVLGDSLEVATNGSYSDIAAMLSKADYMNHRNWELHG